MKKEWTRSDLVGHVESHLALINRKRQRPKIQSLENAFSRNGWSDSEEKVLTKECKIVLKRKLKIFDFPTKESNLNCHRQIFRKTNILFTPQLSSNISCLLCNQRDGALSRPIWPLRKRRALQLMLFISLANSRRICLHFDYVSRYFLLRLLFKKYPFVH